tara:strand:+ start:583 stop:810 length:228 start_codon:yes stop_codon:yes gene_type:complete
MKKLEEINEIRSKLNSSDISDIKYLTEELAKFLEEDYVSTEGIINLENISNTLNNFRRAYTSRVISLMKQAHMVD